MKFAQQVLFQLKQRKAAAANRLLRHPLQPGQVFDSPGGTTKYRVVGAVCQLYDRSLLPYPCCSLGEHGKAPSWRRIGRRFVPDMATKRSPSYCVQLIGYPEADLVVKTLYWIRLTPRQQEWWYSKRQPDARRT